MSPVPRPRTLGRLAGAAVGTAAGVFAAGAAAELVAERRATRRRTGRAPGAAPLGSLRGAARTVTADDGVPLHVEVDEPSTHGGEDRSGLTVVFVHGYALNLDCWHFQRQSLRGRHRLVLYDQRSHGRSGRSDGAQCTVDMLARDLRRVLDAVAPSGPVVLVAHSMGGMAVMALAEQAPELFGDRVVGTALLATSAGDLDRVTLGVPGPPGRLLHRLAPGALATLARMPAFVETGRRAGSELMSLFTQRYAFGGPVDPELADFADEMLAATPIGVVSAFFPVFALHNRYAALAALRAVPVLVVGATKDQITPAAHSREIVRRLPSAYLRELDGAGHMLMLERAAEVDAALEQLLARVADEAVA